MFNFTYQNTTKIMFLWCTNRKFNHSNTFWCNCFNIIRWRFK